MKPLMLESWPQAIAHLDADAFFASVEQALHPELKGMPVITGAERGIVAAASYEAKALGIGRGVPLSEVKKKAPHCILLPSDYETYSLYSSRLYHIIRRFTPTIEEYSIDEAFFDLTGLRRLYRCSYWGVLQKIQETVHAELDIPVSLGVSLSKTLAKIASKWCKPKGLTAIPGRKIHEYLAQTPIISVWGFGKSTTAFLQKKNIQNAYDYVRQPLPTVKKWLGKVGVEKYRELRGEAVYPLQLEEKTTYTSIQKFKTFTPCGDKEIIYARALRNLESACIKARRYGLSASSLTFIIREHNFRTRGTEVSLSRSENSPLILNHFLKTLFEELYQNSKTYRSTGVVLGQLQPTSHIQLDLFENPISVLKKTQVYSAIDEISKRFGKHTVFLGPCIMLPPYHAGIRSQTPERKTHLLKGETQRQHLNLPLLHYKGV
ncbi:MAG: DNA polymerase IV [Deltaproteobacteria bacterium]|nr:DNA polymerase IV [Deltaproteobacteria bacterium]